MAFDDLTLKQQLFCLEYVKDGNGTQAAVRAGYSEDTARVIASENLTKPAIAEQIARLKRDRQEKIQVDAEWLLRELVVQYHKAADGDREAAALKALDLIGKHCDVGAFKDRLEISGGLQMTHEQALKELE